MVSQAVNPDPNTLFIPDPDEIPSVLGNKAAAIFGGALSFSMCAVHRYFSKRPALSGIQLHIVAAAVGIGVGHFLQERKNRYNQDRDAVFRHYIELHPEDFPPPERKRVGEVFKTWSPVR